MVSRAAARRDPDEESHARDAARRASHSRPVRLLARVGLASSGVVHALIGVLAILVANGLRTAADGESANADQTGALGSIAAVPGGVLVLWVAAASLFGLAVWQWTGPRQPQPETSVIVSRRTRNHSKAVGFAVVGLAALAFAVGGRADGAQTTRSISAALIDIPGGVFVLAGIGVGVGVAGGVFVFRGVSRNFMEDVDPPRGLIRVAVLALGVGGHTVKGLTLLMVGLLFVGGALFTDSSWTTGLDGAVRFLAGLPTGVWPIFIAGGGFIAQGLYLVCRGIFLRR